MSNDNDDDLILILVNITGLNVVLLSVLMKMMFQPWHKEFDYIHCLWMAAILSSYDPGSLVKIFKEIGEVYSQF